MEEAYAEEDRYDQEDVVTHVIRFTFPLDKFSD